MTRETHPTTETLAEVAVPIPLRQSLVYRVPGAFEAIAEPGSRVRVPVGRRRLVGVILARDVPAPEGVELRELEAVIDLEPVVPPSLLELGRFAADYYLAPIGEVFRAVVPAGLEPWGDRRVWLTDRGALGTPRDALERVVVEAVREHGRLALSDLGRLISQNLEEGIGTEAVPALAAPRRKSLLAELEETLASLRKRGWLVLGTKRESGGSRGRYVAAVELAGSNVEELLERCGRSAPGRRVVEHLSAIGRPATVREVCGAAECSPGVVRRLRGLGVLREFSQIEALPLTDHLAAARGSEPPVLRPDQESAAQAIVRAVGSGQAASFLLGGVTGSGKTEVYLRGVSEVLESGRSAILLVPEISLVPALASTVRARFGERLALLHSALGAGERAQEWERIRRGEARVVLGPRSAIFAPVRQLGLVVVDEEQDTAFKQETSPRYHGRDLALIRARDEQATTVLVSATPSLETLYNVSSGKYSGLRLTERVGQGELPEGILVDLRKLDTVRRPGDVVFSPRLTEEIEATLGRGEQAILLRNRRGYSPVLLCRACGEDLSCEDCGLPRTYHKRFEQVLCHYCGSRLPAPKRCVSCGEEALDAVGSGTERVEETFSELFPGVAVDTLDRDAVRRRGSLAAVLERFDRGETQVLIGTQMVAKGHHFPQVSLTAVLHADTYLAFPDFRAVERTYSMLTQVAGRAGRGDLPGRVVIQTYHPDHYAIQAALNHDDEAFVREEMRFRRIFHYPPYTRMVQLLLRHRQRAVAEKEAEELGRSLNQHPLSEGVRVLGPAPAPFEKLRGKWRFQILLRGESGGRLRRLVSAVLPENPKGDLIVDVDPQELL